MKWNKLARRAGSGLLVATIAVAGTGVMPPVAEAGTKTVTVKKDKAYFSKYRAAQVKVVNKLLIETTDLDRPGRILYETYLPDSEFAKDIPVYNKKAEGYAGKYDATRRALIALAKSIKNIDTVKEETAYKAKLKALQKDVAYLKKTSKALVPEGRALYRAIVAQNTKQEALFEACFGDVDAALVLASQKPYIAKLVQKLQENGVPAVQIDERLHHAYEAMSRAKFDPNSVVEKKRGAIMALIHSGKLIEANEVFVETRDQVLPRENAKLDEAFNKIVARFAVK